MKIIKAKEGYIKPVNPYIGSSQRKLYALENERNNIIKKCTEELGVVLNHGRSDYWKRTMAESLFSILGNYESSCSILAAQAYLESKGWTVSNENS